MQVEAAGMELLVRQNMLARLMEENCSLWFAQAATQERTPPGHQEGTGFHPGSGFFCTVGWRINHS